MVIGMIRNHRVRISAPECGHGIKTVSWDFIKTSCIHAENTSGTDCEIFGDEDSMLKVEIFAHDLILAGISGSLPETEEGLEQRKELLKRAMETIAIRRSPPCGECKKKKL